MQRTLCWWNSLLPYAKWSAKVPGSNLIITGIYHPPYSTRNPFSNSNAPTYLTEPIQEYVLGRRGLHSCGARSKLVVLCTIRKTFAQRSFSVQGPTLWNQLLGESFEKMYSKYGIQTYSKGSKTLKNISVTPNVKTPWNRKVKLFIGTGARSWIAMMCTWRNQLGHLEKSSKDT